MNKSFIIATCCYVLLIASVTVSEVFAYDDGHVKECLQWTTRGAIYQNPHLRPRRYQDDRYQRSSRQDQAHRSEIHDFRGRNLSDSDEMQEDIETSQLPIVLFDSNTVFPEDFNPFSDMFCNQLNNSEILCFYPKAVSREQQTD